MNPCLYFIGDELLQGSHVDPCAADPFASCRSHLAALGFGPVISNAKGNATLFPVPHSGPGGEGGAVLAAWPKGEALDLVGYFPDRQTWCQVRPKIWVGWNGCGPVRPEAMDNGNPYDVTGVLTTMADGQEWVMPEIRRPDGHLMPTDCYRDLSGKLITPLKPAFQQLWNESGFFFDLYWAVFIDGERDRKLPLERGLSFVTQVLALRYRYCDYTQDALKLVDGTNLETLIGICIGWPAMMRRAEELTEEFAEGQGTDQKKSR